MDAKIKPKSIRKAILMALADGAIVTIDDLQTRIGEPRAKVANNAHAALADLLIKRLRDDVTNSPAYQITAKGREYIKQFSGTADESPAVAEHSIITPGVKEESAVSATINEVLSTEAADALRGEYETVIVDALDKAGPTRTSENNNGFVAAERSREIWVEAQSWKAMAAVFGCTTPDELTERIRELASIVAERRVPMPEPVGFVVQRTIKPMLRFTKSEKAQAHALNLARLGQRAQVFALHRVGNAVPGAEWVPA